MRCTVTSMNYSACGLEIGDYFEVGPEGVSLPPGKHFCFYAIAAVAPMLGERELVACPDPPENLIMRVEEL